MTKGFLVAAKNSGGRMPLPMSISRSRTVNLLAGSFSSWPSAAAAAAAAGSRCDQSEQEGHAHTCGTGRAGQSGQAASAAGPLQQAVRQLSGVVSSNCADSWAAATNAACTVNLLAGSFSSWPSVIREAAEVQAGSTVTQGESTATCAHMRNGDSNA
jgi:hypothetical protein